MGYMNCPFCGIYKIVNTANGHCYIGSTVNLARRKYFHFWLLRREDHHSPYLQRAWDRYGEDAFEFHPLLYCDPHMRLYYEQQCLDNLPSEYNIYPIAGSPKRKERSMEHRKNQSLAMMGHRHSGETKCKIGRGCRNYRLRQLDRINVEEARRLRMCSYTYSEISDITNISRTTVARIIKREGVYSEI